MTEHDTQHHHADSHLRSLYTVYLALMVLLVVTVGASFMHLPGQLNIIVTMLIAVVKATMVVLIFMHVKHSGKLVWVFAASAFVWLGILLALTLSDYVTRNDVTRGTPFPQDAPFAHTIATKRAPQPKG